jgi:concanavalin A-like lectin/glucanase superfamily protein/Ig-like domain-containing protein
MKKLFPLLEMKTLSLVLTTFVLVISSLRPVLAADVIDASLRMRFNFDSAPVSNVIVDSSPSGTHPGTNFSAIWSSSELGRSGVMDFKAPILNRITVPAIPALNSSTGTISFWIKTPAYLASGDYAMLVDRRTQDGDVIALTDTGNIFVQAQAGGNGVNSFTGIAAINDNNWHNVAYVYDQSATGSITIFVDGLLDTSQTNSQAWSWPASQAIELGSSHVSFWRPLVGLMDDFQIHNRKLSASEVAATFAGNPVIDSSLVERLDFAAAPINNVVIDTSASNNSATNQAATWVSADTGRSGLMRFDLVFTQITVAADPEFNSPTGTIAFWMKSAGNTGPGQFASILFDRRTGVGDVISMQDDGTIFVQAYGSGGGNSFATQGRVNDGLWHHVAYVYDQSATGSIQIYIDGASSGFQTNSGAWSWPPGQELELARSHDSYWFGFEGALDEVRFYNRPLSAAEVAMITPPSFHFDIKPQSQTAFVGDDVLFTAIANMTATYQWRFSGTNLSGATTTSLALTNVQAANAGSYTIVASNATFGAITSPPAILTLNPRPSLTASLVARYNFDAAPVNGVIVDTAPGSRHPGTNRHAATWAASVAGRSGVMRFSAADPGSQITVPPHPDFDSTKGTISFWMKSPTNDMVFGNYAAIIFDRRSDATTGYGNVFAMVDDGTLFVQAYRLYFTENSFATTNTVNDDKWHHVAHVYDQGVNGFIRIYVDGQLAASNPNSGPWAWDPAEEIELGESNTTYWRRYNGYLDDVQFYNRILSASEVAQSMTLGSISYSRIGNQLTLSWSWDQSGLVLQENSSVSNPAGWTDVPGGSSSPVTVTISPSGNRFYRLHKP